MGKYIPEISEEPITAEVVAHSSFLVSTGATGTRFLTEIKDNKKLVGTKCSGCGKVYCPPRLHCPDCFVRMDEWVDLGGKGTLSSYTVVRYKESYHLRDIPYAYGVILMDGADTALVHMLGGVDLDKIEVGMRVEPVFKEEREGSFLDIDYFKPSS
jgi:uncharacterized OB-fold protein